MFPRLCVNADSNSSYRNLVGGFIVLAKNAEIENCFFAGEIRGNVYTPKNPPSYSPPIVSDFIGTVTNTQIRNCFVLHTPESFAKGIIGDISDIEPYDIQIFYSKEEMNMLTEKLNFCSKKDIWICDKNGLPILNYLKNNKKIY